MNVHIQIIPHHQQRYQTTGDWVVHENGDITIYISNVDNWKSEILVAIHELVESVLCIDRGISQWVVDEFDISHPELEDPGADQRAPYYKEHEVAEGVERVVASELNVNWEEHQNRLEALYIPPTKK